MNQEEQIANIIEDKKNIIEIITGCKAHYSKESNRFAVITDQKLIDICDIDEQLRDYKSGILLIGVSLLDSGKLVLVFASRLR